VITGFSLVLLAASLNGAYAIPMKFMSRWRWENIWLVWTVLSLWVLPIALACEAVRHPVSPYREISWASLTQMGLLGLLWGIGVLLIGMSFPLVGVAIGTAAGLGCATAMGTLLPVLFAGTPLSRTAAISIPLGVTVVLLGVGVCGFAGRMRERQQSLGSTLQRGSTRGFVFASLGGTLTAALNLAFATGAPIAAAVEQQHSSTPVASIAIWIPVLLAGGIPGTLYTVGLLGKNRGFAQFWVSGTAMYWALVPVMSILWLGSIVVYGVGVTEIGALGLIVGWPAFMSGAVVASTIWGTLFGEWRHSGRTAKLSMASGIVLLMAAIAVLAKTSR
jgi:L-rhamnose-H+ transport protein